MSQRESGPAISSEIELACVVPLPASTSTLFVSINSLEVPTRRPGVGNSELFDSGENITAAIGANMNESALAPVDTGFAAWSFVRNLSHQCWPHC